MNYSDLYGLFPKYLKIFLLQILVYFYYGQHVKSYTFSSQGKIFSLFFFSFFLAYSDVVLISFFFNLVEEKMPCINLYFPDIHETGHVFICLLPVMVN